MASLCGLCLPPEGLSLLSQLLLAPRKVTDLLVRLGLRICDEEKFGTQSTVSNFHSVPLLSKTQDTRMSLAVSSQ